MSAEARLVRAGPQPSAVVRRRLQAYADRGVFRGFSARRGRGARHEFRFLWLTPRPVEASFETSARTLTFRNLLVNMPARSATYADLKRFIAGRSIAALPSHRRIEPRRAGVRCSNRAGNVSLVLTGKPQQEGYVVNRGVNLVNEVFVWLRESYADYMWQNFDAPQE